MHEALVLGATALGGYAALLVGGLRWHWRRRRAPLQIGDRAPDGRLWDAQGRFYRLHSLAGRAGLVVVFMSNRCPGVKAYDARLRRLHESYVSRGVSFVGVNPVDDGIFPGESQEEMEQVAAERGLVFPYLKDRDQGVARSLGAVCTPHVFVLDGSGHLRYRGRVDDALLEERVKRRFLADVLDAILAGRPGPVTETAPLGCTIEFTSASTGHGRSASFRTDRSTA